MAAYQHQDGNGTMFPNDRKPEGSKQPDYRGDALYKGELLEVAAWNRNGRLSLSIKPKQQRDSVTGYQGKPSGKTLADFPVGDDESMF